MFITIQTVTQDCNTHEDLPTVFSGYDADAESMCGRAPRGPSQSGYDADAESVSGLESHGPVQAGYDADAESMADTWDEFTDQFELESSLEDESDWNPEDEESWLSYHESPTPVSSGFSDDGSSLPSNSESPSSTSFSSLEGGAPLLNASETDSASEDGGAPLWQVYVVHIFRAG
ncbi:hypothetical protein SPI_02561 [Niveomyces insectorum RCEF 264]|uniref:Uncharacterized protein n=1 Tax=Niveomyces insectorum RCEF 264 TaxID=1081102 RepID=A0A167Y338_9HYPO|nr:hypothetical protein SPI_02561 [Niveomyces insectorum RCEF 264]